MEDHIITVDEVRKYGYCASGIYRWCKAEGLNFRQLLNEGMRESDLEKMDDGIAQNIVRLSRERRGK